MAVIVFLEYRKEFFLKYWKKIVKYFDIKVVHFICQREKNIEQEDIFLTIFNIS